MSPRVAAITGASSSLGRATASLFAQRGRRLDLIDGRRLAAPAWLAGRFWRSV
jgi:NAD(P)-dependent dehydrogenase (short-subunit alcohol dehydrogenase family)